MLQGVGPSVFLSHAHADVAVARGLAIVLRALQHRVFFSGDSVTAGVRWRDVIINELDAVDSMIVLWSESACRSEYVELEWRYWIRHREAQPCIPVRLDRTPLAPQLAEFQAVDLPLLQSIAAVGGAGGTALSRLAMLEGRLREADVVLGMRDLARAAPAVGVSESVALVLLGRRYAAVALLAALVVGTVAVGGRLDDPPARQPHIPAEVSVGVVRSDPPHVLYRGPQVRKVPSLDGSSDLPPATRTQDPEPQDREVVAPLNNTKSTYKPLLVLADRKYTIVSAESEYYRYAGSACWLHGFGPNMYSVSLDCVRFPPECAPGETRPGRPYDSFCRRLPDGDLRRAEGVSVVAEPCDGAYCGYTVNNRAKTWAMFSGGTPGPEALGLLYPGQHSYFSYSIGGSQIRDDIIFWSPFNPTNPNDQRNIFWIDHPHPRSEAEALSPIVIGPEFWDRYE